MLSPELPDRLSRVRLLIFDVDGVLTDGSLRSDQGGRRWSVKDGFGFYLARSAGLKLALCSGKDHEEIRARAKALGMSCLKLGRIDKAEAVREILGEEGLEEHEALFVGDDLFDLPAMAAVGLSAAPADARPELLERVDWPLSTKGGEGAAREIIEGVLKAQGLWNESVAPFVEAQND